MVKQQNKLLMKTIKLIILLLLPCFFVTAQSNMPLSSSKTYKLIDVELVGEYNIDKKSVMKLMDLSLNQNITVPGDEITNGLKTLWNQKLSLTSKYQRSKKMRMILFCKYI